MRKRLSKNQRYLQQYHIDYLQENAAKLTTLQLSEAMGFSQSTIITWCHRLKIKATKSYFQTQMPVIPVCEP